MLPTMNALTRCSYIFEGGTLENVWQALVQYVVVTFRHKRSFKFFSFIKQFSLKISCTQKPPQRKSFSLTTHVDTSFACFHFILFPFTFFYRWMMRIKKEKYLCIERKRADWLNVIENRFFPFSFAWVKVFFWGNKMKNLWSKSWWNEN